MTFLDVQVTYRLNGSHADFARSCIENEDHSGLLEIVESSGQEYSMEHYDGATGMTGLLL